MGPSPVDPAAFARTACHQAFGYPPRRLFRAPGRVYLIGGHTDCRDVFVLPVTIDPAVWVAAAPRL